MHIVGNIMNSILNINYDPKDQPMFLGDSLGAARYDRIKYPIIEKMYKEMRSFFWQPYEITLTEDKRDFNNKMSEEQKFIFSSVLSRQVILDSIQQRGPIEVLSKYASIPELEPLLLTYAYMEQIHSESYSWTIRNVYNEPDKIFNNISQIPIMIDCVERTTKFYDQLNHTPSKKNLLLCLFSVNALEAIQFYASFACSFAFAENDLMHKNAKLIKLIARDEAVHHNMTKIIIQLLLRDEPEYIQIFEDNKEEFEQIYFDVADMEKKFADYVFQNGSMFGINSQMLKSYIDFVTTKAMRKIGLKYHTPVSQNPLPYMDKHLNTAEQQDSPQEEEVIDYLQGVEDDVTEEKINNLHKKFSAYVD